MQVLNRSKRIEGIDCLVVSDLVKEGGDLVESTDDWFAFSHDGDIWYCGEEVKSFESFDGDHPRREELVGIDGSFKAGRQPRQARSHLQGRAPRRRAVRRGVLGGQRRGRDGAC